MIWYIFGLLFVFSLLVLRTYSTVHLTPRLQQWLSSGSYYNYTADIRIFYREYLRSKNQPPRNKSHKILLLLHGYPSSSWDWHKIWQPMCDKYEFPIIYCKYIY